MEVGTMQCSVLQQQQQQHAIGPSGRWPVAERLWLTRLIQCEFLFKDRSMDPSHSSMDVFGHGVTNTHNDRQACRYISLDQYNKLYTARGQGAPITIGVPPETARLADLDRSACGLAPVELAIYIYLFIYKPRPTGYRQTTYRHTDKRIIGPTPLVIGEKRVEQ